MPASSPRILPGLGLKGFFGAGTEGYDADMDNNMRLVSALCQLRVIARVDTLPTSGMVNGDIYIETTGMNANQIAIRDNGVWVYIPVAVGFRAYDAYMSKFINFNGTAWVYDSALISVGQASVGTAAYKDILNIPAGHKRVKVTLDGASFAATDSLLWQLGGSGGVETSSGYSGTVTTFGSSTIASTVSPATGIISSFTSQAASIAYTGDVIIERISSASPRYKIAGHLNAGAAQYIFQGTKTLATELSTVRFGSSGGSNFDAGLFSYTVEM